jgi:hypothetical protein
LELLFFLFFLVIALGFVAIGFYKASFPPTVLGAVLVIVLGLFVIGSGITTEKVEVFEVDDLNVSAPVQISLTYEHHSAQDVASPVWIIGYLLLFGGVVVLLASAYFAFFAPENYGGGFF